MDEVTSNLNLDSDFDRHHDSDGELILQSSFAYGRKNLLM